MISFLKYALKYSSLSMSRYNSMKLCYLVLSVLAIIQENILPTSGHCCHPCIHKGPLRSCSVECSGKLIDDGRCGSDDVSIESVLLSGNNILNIVYKIDECYSFVIAI